MDFITVRRRNCQTAVIGLSEDHPHGDRFYGSVRTRISGVGAINERREQLRDLAAW
jgi:hypothetical protein